MALGLGPLHQVRYHDNGRGLLLPHQTPEVNHCVWQWTWSVIGERREREGGGEGGREGRKEGDSVNCVHTTGHMECMHYLGWQGIWLAGSSPVCMGGHSS